MGLSELQKKKKEDIGGGDLGGIGGGQKLGEI